MKAVLPLAVLLSSCNQPSGTPPTNEVANTVSQPVAKPAAPTAKAFVYNEKNDLTEFHFAWSAEAAAIPQLVDRFRKEMDEAKAELIAGAREDKAMREKEGDEFHGYMWSTDYRTAGQSDRLLSLSSEDGSYTGGAHGNYSDGGMIWDRQAAKQIRSTDLFAAPANMDRLLTQRWCDALNKAREEKRGEPVSGDGMFDECPKLSEIWIVPTDKNRNGRLEILMLKADPYVAGPYAEGSYEIELSVTPELIAALKSDYQGSFEVGQPQ